MKLESFTSAAVALAALATCAPAAWAGRDEPRRAPTHEETRPATLDWGAMPLTFEPNLGQFGDRSLFGAVAGPLRLGAHADGLHLRLGETRVHMAVRGAAPVTPRGESRQDTRLHYYPSADAGTWVEGSPTFAAVRYARILPRIDLVVHGKAGALEYDFEVAPGGDPSRIVVDVTGQESMTLTPTGDLQVETRAGTIVQRKPVAYQEIDGTRRAVPVTFVVGRGAVRFAVGSYDRTRPLVIDPEVSFASYLGTASNDSLTAISAGPGGSMLLARRQGDLACVSRVSFASGPRVDYTTCLGAAGFAHFTVPRGIAATADGGAVVVGTTDDANFPTTAGAYDRTCSCEANSFSDVSDAFITRLDASGAITASTYLGAADESEFMRLVAIGPTGTIAVAGQTDGRVLPVVGGPATARLSNVQRSSDGGASWSARGLSAAIRQFAVSPTDPDELLAGAGLNLHRSTDGGRTWTRVIRLLSSSNRNPTFEALAYAPDGRTIYAGSLDDQGLRVSSDGGATWTFAPLARGFRGGITALGTYASAPDVLLACNEVGLQRSSNRGVSFTTQRAACGPISSTPAGVVYTGGAAPARSDDGGITWRTIAPLPQGSAVGIGVNPSAPDDVLAVATSGGGTSTTAHLYRSADGGATWTQIWTTPFGGGAAGLRYTTITFDPTTSSRAFVSLASLVSATSAVVDGSAVTISSPARPRLQVAPSNPSIVYHTPLTNPGDIAVAQFSPDLSTLNYTALVSSSDNEGLVALAYDPDGRLLVLGSQGATDGPFTRSLSPAPRTPSQFVLMQLDPRLTGDASVVAAVGMAELNLSGLAVDPTGAVLVSGNNRVNNVTVPAAWTARGARTTVELTDAIVLKLSPDLQQVLGGTYVGGPGNDFGSQLTRDAQGALYLRVVTPSAAAPLGHLGVPSAMLGSGPFTTAYVRIRPGLDVIEDLVYVSGVSPIPVASDAGILLLGTSAGSTATTLPTTFARGPLQPGHAGDGEIYLARVDFTPLAPRLTLDGPSGGRATGGTLFRIRTEGTSGTPVAMVGGQPARVTKEDANTFRFATPTLPTGAPVDVSVTVDGQTLTIAGAYTPLADDALNGDADNDGLPDAWEARYSLDPTRDDAADDADGDGQTNAAEFAAGTHPGGTFARYLAEGAESDFFSHRIALVNPTALPVTAVVRAFTGDGTVERREVVVGAERRVTLDAAAQAGLVGKEFASEIQTSSPLIVERTMRWDGSGYGSHSETATIAPARQWYFAEGATIGRFDLFFLIQNPGSTPATVKASYLLASGQALEKTYTVPAGSRFNVWANVEEFETADGPKRLLGAAEFSTVFEVTSGPNVIAERAMYLSGARPFAAGHQAAGVTAPATRWFLAEGATGDYFDLFVLIGNPGATPATLTVSYLLPDGSTRVKDYVVGARSRFNIWVDEEQFPEGSGDKALANTAVSVVIDSTNGVPIVVERAMWWPGPTFSTWQEAHNSAATRVTAARWGVADGEVGAGWANGDCAAADDCDETYVLVANTGATAGVVRATLIHEDAAPESQVFPIAANSRLNIAVREAFPSSIGKRVGMVVEAVDTPLPLVVERATYGNAGGVKWAAGANAPGTPLP